MSGRGALNAMRIYRIRWIAESGLQAAFPTFSTACLLHTHTQRHASQKIADPALVGCRRRRKKSLCAATAIFLGAFGLGKKRRCRVRCAVSRVCAECDFFSRLSIEPHRSNKIVSRMSECVCCVGDHCHHQQLWQYLPLLPSSRSDPSPHRKSSDTRQDVASRNLLLPASRLLSAAASSSRAGNASRALSTSSVHNAITKFTMPAMSPT